MIYTVTIDWQGAEIGFGEGESEEFAREEAIESVDGIYLAARAEWTFTSTKPDFAVLGATE